MDDRRDTTAVTKLASVMALAVAIGVAGRFSEAIVGGASGAAVRMFLRVLSGAVVTHAFVKVLFPYELPSRLAAFHRWLWLALATGLAVITYLVEDDGLSTTDVVLTTMLSILLLAATALFLMAVRRQRHVARQRGLG